MNSSQSDEDLVENMLGGGEDAFLQLYNRYRRPIYSIAFRILQNSEEALDATQEIFIKVYRSLGSFDRKKSRFYAWVCHLAANHAIDCWRARRRRAETQFPTELADHSSFAPVLHNAIRSPYGEIEDRDRIGRIRQQVGKLPELQKKIFILRYFQGLRLREIAEMEGCTLGTVKMLLFRATQTVRRALKQSRGQL
jgi:RNA polymerase sigma-70 factor, ECF subfamily